MNINEFGRTTKRPGVSGILAAAILFAAFFATGTGFFMYVNNSVGQANKANASNVNSGVQASQEKLLVTVKPANTLKYPIQVLGVRANNTGGIPVTIVDAYITCMSGCAPYQYGQLLSSSAYVPTLGSHFLKQGPSDLNQSLPITLGVGGSTKYQGGDLGINLASCLSCALIGHGEYVVVTLLTSRGNVFSAQYPPSPLPSTTDITQVTDSNSVEQVLIGGGPQLAVLLSATAACPPPEGGTCTQTFSCVNGCVTLTATIYNLANSPASSVSLTLYAPPPEYYNYFVSGTASVTLFSACTPSTQTILAGGSGQVTCQFNAATGATGGLASFSGHASATINGVTVQSAQADSNSIEIGGLASVTTQGAFASNFFFLKYSSCTQDNNNNYQSPCTPIVPMPPSSVNNLPSGSYLAGGSNFYTAFYMQVTNVFNTSLPITQYSYTFGDPDISGEVYYFLAGSNTTMTNGAYYPNYAASTPTLTQYPTDCATVNANNKPTDSKCLYVNPGQTVTLTFAACGYGSKSWAWGGQRDASSFDSGASGCTGNAPNLTVPEGMVLGIVISFAYKNTIFTQMMPFEGQAYLRATQTQLACSPSSVGAGGPSTCTATVLDKDVNSFNNPTGTVTFGGQALSLGTFSSTTCTLSTGSCAVTYTPFPGTLGPVAMTAAYGGDDWHMSSSNSTTLTVLRATMTSVSCVPVSLLVNTATTCTATVTDTSSSPLTPTTTVSFTTNPVSSGSFAPASCTLAGSGSTATCTTQFTPSPGKEGSITVTGTYNGDSLHMTSSGAAAVTATKRASSISISCSPTTIPVTGPTTCTATVTDTSPGTAVTPTGGTVTFSASPSTSGSFTPASGQCTTSGGQCTVTYTPGAGKEGSVTITASYAGDTDHTGSGPSSGVTLTITKITTTTSVTCSPNPDGLNSPSTCTVTVADSGGATETPTGTITFTASPSGDGSFSSTTCTLSGGSCSVTFTPSSVASITITASYGGDGDHLASSGSTTLTSAKRTTSTAVSCSPSSVVVNQASTCTVTVTDTGGSGSSTPTGTVTFTVAPSGSGTFSLTTCTLVAGTCSVTFTPTSGHEGSLTITGTYGGDAVHAGSSGTATVTATKRNTSVTISCSPNPVVDGSSATCTATVADTSTGTTITPTGTVTWTLSTWTGNNGHKPTFSSGTCTLSVGSCSVTFSSKSGYPGTATIQAAYGGDTDHSTSTKTYTETVS